MYSLLSKYGWIEAHPNSQANFILSKITQVPAFLLAAKLRNEGVLVRYYSNSKLMHHVRFSVGRPEETKALARVLDEINRDPTALTTEYLSSIEGVLWDMDGVFLSHHHLSRL